MGNDTQEWEINPRAATKLSKALSKGIGDETCEL